MRKQTQITLIRHVSSYKQLEVKTNRISFLCGNRNGNHNKERRRERHTIDNTQKKKKRLVTRTPPTKKYDEARLCLFRFSSPN